MNKNNKILLINPWIYDFAAYDFWIKPIGLLSIGSILHKFGYQLNLIDCLDRFHPLLVTGKVNSKLINKKFGSGKFHREVVEKPEFFADIPRKFCRYGLPLNVFNSALSKIPTPDVVLVTSGMTYWYPGPVKAIEIVKKKFPKVPIVLGGIYATLFFDHAVKNSGADYVIKGPGEEQALKLVDELTGNQSDWNEFPQSWHEMPEPIYYHYHTLPSLPILTSKGCPFRCSFCASHILSGTFQQRDPDKIVKTIEYYYHNRKIKNIAFFDDALLVNSKKHLSKILKKLLRKKIHVNFHTPNGIHPSEINKELAELMFRSNFKTIRLSYETSDKERQQAMKQKVSDDALVNALDLFEKAGYNRKDIDVYVIMGLPGQPLEEVVNSMIFVISLGARITVIGRSTSDLLLSNSGNVRLGTSNSRLWFSRRRGSIINQ